MRNSGSEEKGHANYPAVASQDSRSFVGPAWTKGRGRLSFSVIEASVSAAAEMSKAAASCGKVAKGLGGHAGYEFSKTGSEEKDDNH